MQIIIEVADTKAGFVLELLNSLPFVAIQQNGPSSGKAELEYTQQLSPKTAQLLGLFPQLADPAGTDMRQQSILRKHA